MGDDVLELARMRANFGSVVTKAAQPRLAAALGMVC